MSTLTEELIKLYESDEYPLHMPGHKRQDTGSALDDAYHLDITEIEGYDNLYDARGILRDAMDRAAALYGCPHTYYLVNGSTVGILIAVHTVAAMYDQRDRILVASNCHRSVRAGAELAGLKADIIDTESIDIAGDADTRVKSPDPEDEEDAADSGSRTAGLIHGGIQAASLEKRLADAAAAGASYAAVVLTSPTYEGIISDIEVAADICHRYDTVLIVDEAHGAHLDLSDVYPGGALRYGADIVIHSTHKTLAAMTQTALLHVQGTLVDITTIEKYWTMLQTSSPSYVLMASIDNALRHITENPQMVRAHMERISGVRSMLMQNREGQGLKSLKLLTERDISGYDSCAALDPCKIVVSTKDTYIDGYALQKILLDDHHIQLEMAADDYIVGITTYMDTDEGLERFAAALLEIDDRLRDRYYNIDCTLTDDRTERRTDLYAPCIPKGK